MKIIDFETKGNVIQFSLGKDDCDDYWGDDWNDRPYEHNAGSVYDHYVAGTARIYVDWNYDVLIPENDWHYQMNSPFSKEDFKNREAPCVVIYKPKDNGWSFDSTYSTAVLSERATRFYFNDHMEPGNYFFKEDKMIPFEK